MLKQRMWALQFAGLIQLFLCLNFLVWYGSLYVVVANTSKDSFYILRFDRDAYNAITCEDSFDILRFDQDFYGFSQALFSYGPPWSCQIYLFENTWYIFRKFFLIPSFLIIMKTRCRKMACCHPMGDRKTTRTQAVIDSRWSELITNHHPAPSSCSP